MTTFQDEKTDRLMFQKLTQILGLTLPADREQAIYEGYAGLRTMADGLRRPRTAASNDRRGGRQIHCRAWRGPA